MAQRKTLWVCCWPPAVLRVLCASVVRSCRSFPLLSSLARLWSLTTRARAIMPISDCSLCAEVAGRITAPGGTIFDDGLWHVSHHTGPQTEPGELIVKVRRHCESLAELTAGEAAALGPILRAAVTAIERWCVRSGSIPPPTASACATYTSFSCPAPHRSRPATSCPIYSARAAPCSAARGWPTILRWGPARMRQRGCEGTRHGVGCTVEGSSRVLTSLLRLYPGVTVLLTTGGRTRRARRARRNNNCFFVFPFCSFLRVFAPLVSFHRLLRAPEPLA